MLHVITIGPDGIHMMDSDDIKQMMEASEKHEATRNGCDCVGPSNDVQACAEELPHPDAPKHSGHWVCTRPKGHEGKHRACGIGEHNRHEWEDEKGFEA